MAPATRRKAVDKAIDALIKADPCLSQLFDLITSVPGIGTATATEIVLATARAAPQRDEDHY
ncbi:hypothetical protein [Spirosoma aerophilum]